MKLSFDKKVRLIGFIFLIIAFFCVGRLYFLQIIHGEAYRAKSSAETLSSAEKLFDRGAIYFEQKGGTAIGAAAIRAGYILGVEPGKINDPEAIYEKLNKFTAIDKESFIKKASLKDDPYEEILRRLSPEISTKILEEKVPGVSILKEQWRVYPGDSLSAHVLGFVGYDGSVINGRYGLERYYEDNLRRDDSFIKKNFFVELFTDAKKLTRSKEELEADIITSIEPTVERILEEEIEKINQKYGAKLTSGIIMDPNSGEIVAAAAYPTFNPNKYNEEKNVAVFSNPLVEKVYEMGSILKPITIAAGLDSGIITASTTYKDEGFLEVNDRTIYNFDRKGRGVVSMQEVLNQSLNTGAATIALWLGKKKFVEYVNNFGLGEETGIDLPSEAGGLIKNLEKGGEVELANGSFGQGIAVTPIAMTRALSALGNGGVLPNPHIVKQLNYKLGFSKKIVSTEEEKRRVIKKETSEEITRMLVNVVDKALKGGAIKMEHYSIAAKTGTAQIANREEGGYYSDRFLHSFFGYFPAYNPRFIIFLYTVEPQADYASDTLTIPFSNLTKFLINYYQIPPDR